LQLMKNFFCVSAPISHPRWPMVVPPPAVCSPTSHLLLSHFDPSLWLRKRNLFLLSGFSQSYSLSDIALFLPLEEVTPKTHLVTSLTGTPSQWKRFRVLTMHSTPFFHGLACRTSGILNLISHIMSPPSVPPPFTRFDHNTRVP